MASPALNYVYNGPLFVMPASGGFQTQQTFDTIHTLTEATIFQFDVTNSVEVLFDVRTFNTLIGISKDLDNINVTSAHFYDNSENVLYKDSLTITASQFVAGLTSEDVISVGCLSTLYGEFTHYVEKYFGFKGQLGTNDLYGAATFYGGLNNFFPNHGVFDASAFINIINGAPADGNGAFINDLSGQITVSNITQLLRYAVDTNIFGNRDASAGTTASDPYHRSNYGVTDGFFENDLIFIPGNGIQITLNLGILAGSFTSTTMITTAAYGASQDTSFNAFTNSSGTFVETSNLSNSAISRTVSAPLLIRLANLTNASNTGFTVVTNSVGPYTLVFGFNGQYTSVVITRGGVLMNNGNAVTTSTYTDTTVNPATGYSYVFQPYNGSTAYTPFTLSVTTSPPPPPAIAVTVASISYSLGTKTATSIQLNFTGTFNTYTISRGSGNYIIYSGVAADTTYTDNNNGAGLSPNTAYIYYIIPYTSTNSPGASTPTSLTTYTLSNVSSLTTSYIDTSSITVNVNGAYASYQLFRNDLGSTALTTASSTTYMDTSLNANTSYVYTVVSQNATGDVTNYPGQSWSFTTLPRLSTVSLGIQTATTLQLVFTGAYQYLTITRSDGQVVARALYDVSFMDTGLTADSSYSYTVVPYNTTGNGSALTYYTRTLGGVTANTFIVSSYGTNNITLSFNGTYSYVKLYRSTGGQTAVQIGGNITAGVTSYSDTTVAPNTSYTYYIYPYNVLNQRGSAQSVSQTTMANLTSLYVGTQTTNSVQIQFAGAYNYVKLVRTDGGVNTSIVQDVSYTDTNVMVDTAYSYTATPYDLSGNPNNTASLSVNAYTLPSLNTGSVVLGTVTGYSVQIGFAGTYNYVDICRNGITIATNVYGTNYTDIYGPSNPGLLGNTTYTYTVVPYNLATPVNQAGSQGTVVATTLPIINTPVTFSATYNTVRLTFTGKYDFFDICRNGVSVTGVRDTSFTDTGLTDDYLYNYTVVPKSNGGGIGVPVNISVYTLPRLTSFTSSAITTTSVVLNLVGYYQYVNLYRNGSLLVAKFTGSTYQDMSLNSNQSYTYTATPYNPYDLSGDSVTLTSIITFPTVNSFAANPLVTTPSAVGLSFSGYYDYVALTRSDGGLRIPTLYDISYVDSSGVIANTPYTYTITPYHSDGTAGNPISLPVYSRPVLTNFLVDPASTSATSIQLDYSGNYGSVTILRTTDNRVVASNYTGVFFTDTSVNRNTQYAYTITPYNPAPALLAGSSRSLVTFSYPVIDPSVNQLLTASSIQLSYTGAYDYLTITRNGTTLTSNWTDASYLDTSLNSNSPYQYTLTPYHIDVCNGNVGVAGTTLTLPTIYTLATTSYGSPQISNNTLSLDVSGTYSSVSITRNQTTGGRGIVEVAHFGDWEDTGRRGTGRVLASDIVSWDDSTMDITSDPYGILDPSGIPIDTVVSGSIRVIGSRKINYRTDSFLDLGLMSNTLYTYVITPYNQLGIPNAPVSFNINTLPTLNHLYIHPNGTDDTSLYVTYDGSFDHVSIYRNDDLDISGVTDSSFLDIGLTANFYPYNYTVIPYNVTNVPGTSLSVSSSTLPLLTAGSFVTTNITSNSITLGYSGIYSSVSIYNNSVSVDLSAVVVQSTGNSSVNKGLSPNTAYIYTIYPYSQLNQAGSSASLSTMTAPVLTSLAVGTKDISSVTLVFNGLYSYVDIYCNDVLVSFDNTTKTFVHTGLAANTYYQYVVIPYNAINYPGSSLYLSTYTSPTLTPFIYSSTVQSNLTTSTSGGITSLLQFMYDGSYSYVDISRNGAGVITNYTSNLYVDSGLSANTTYTYLITPYSPLDNPGVALAFSVITNPIITSVSAGSKTDSTSIQLVITGLYSLFDLSRNGVSVFSKATPPASSYRDTGLSPNGIYTYLFTPYNSGGYPGLPYTFTGYTYAALTAGASYVTGATTNALTLNLGGAYNYVKVDRYDSSGGQLLYTNPSVTGASLVDTGLTPHTSYRYVVTPYNQAFPAQDGSAITLIGSTLPILYTVGAGAQTTDSAQLVFTGAYDYVMIQCINDTTVADATTSDVSYTVLGLTVGAIYAFSVTPYDTSGNAGSALTVNIYQYSLLDAAQVSVGATTTSSIAINFAGANGFGYLHLYRDGTIINGGAPITTSPFVDTGLNEYTSYTYQLAPFNTSDQQGTYVSLSATTSANVPYITSISTGYEDISSIQLNYTGSFAYVNIYRNGTLLSGGVHDTSYTDTGLMTDTPYTYIITPFGNVVQGTSQSLVAYTLPLLNPNSLSVTGISTTSLTLNYSGIFDTVAIYRGSTLLVTGNTGNSYVDNGIVRFPNTTLVYTVTPQNLGKTGASATLSVTTPAVLTALAAGTVTYQSVVITYTGYYNYVTITRSDGTVLTTQGTGGTYTDTGLQGDTQYIYTVTPYNSAAAPVAGASMILTAYTLPSLTMGSLTATNLFANTVLVNFTGNYTFVNLYRNTVMNPAATPVTVSLGITGNYFQDSGLVPNTQYVYTAYPFNSNNPPVQGTSATLTGVTTAAAISNVSFINKTYNSVTLVLDTVPRYDRVKIYRSGFYLGQTSDISFVDSNTSLAAGVPTLQPNTPYQYQVIPYNMANIAADGIVKTTYTGSLITSASVSVYTTGSITLNYTGTYTYVNIYRNDLGTTTALATKVSAPLTSYTDNTCVPDTAYTYTVVPYNLTGEAGTGYQVSSITTLPYLATLTPGRETTSSVQIVFTGSYHYVQVYRGTTLLNGGNQGYDTSYTDTTINTSNTPYAYTVIPYNALDISGSPLSVTVYSVALLNGAGIAATNITNNSAQIIFPGGSYAYTKIYRNGTYLTSISASTYAPYTDTGLSPNTNYIYSLIPYNVTDLSGNSASVNVTTFPYIANNAIVDVSATSTSLTLGFLPPYTNYSSLRITNLTTGGSGGSTMTILSSVTSQTVYSAGGLSPNTQYQFSVVPYNGTGNGTAVTYAKYTLPVITAAYCVSGNTTALSTALVVSGAYTNYTIVRTSPTAATYTLLNGTSPWFSSTGTAIYDTVGLVPNTVYNYLITPYNPTGVAAGVGGGVGTGTSVTATTKTLAYLSSVTTAALTTSSVTLAFNGNYDYVLISQTNVNTGSGAGKYNAFNTPSMTFSIALSTLYSFTIVPMSKNPIVGGSDISGVAVTIQEYALPILSTASNLLYVSATTNSITLNYKSGSYNYVLITRNGVAITGMKNLGSQSSYMDTGLPSNTSYTYIITPYNALDVSGTPVTLTTATLPTLNTVTTGTITTSSIQLILNGSGNSYAYVNITRNGSTLTNQVYDISYTDTTVVPDGSYVYTVTPFNVSGTAGTPYTLSTYALPSIGTVQLTNATAGRTTYTLVGSYYLTFDVSRNDQTVFRNINGTTFTDSTTLANTQYTYLFTPYNPAKVAGGGILVNYQALPTITSLVAGGSNQVDTSGSIGLTFTGLYDYVVIQRNGTVLTTIASGVGTSYVDTNLTADTPYTYTVVPYSRVATGDISGAYVSALAYTQPFLSAFGASTVGSNTITLNITGVYYNANITRTSGNTSIIYYGISGSTYVDTVTPNTPYTYTITPYAPNVLAGASSSFSTVSSAAVTVSGGTVSDTSFQLLFGGGYASLSATLDGTAVFTKTTGLTNYTFVLAAGTGYNQPHTVVLSAFNTLGLLGQTVTYSAYTLAVLTSVSTGAVTAFSVVVNYTGTYSSVGIVRNGVQIAVVPGSTVTSYTDTTAMPNNTYAYSVVPYNGNIPSVAGTILSASTSVTTPAGLNPTVGTLTTTSIQLLFGGSFNYMTIYNGTKFMYQAQPTDTSYTITGLIPNTAYTFILTPYNSGNIAGVAVSSTIYTLPQFSSFITTVTSTTSAQLIFTGSYKYYRITRNGTVIYTNSDKTYDTSYIDTGLSLNSSYNYGIIPYNVTDYSGASLNTTVVISNSVFIYNGGFNLTPSTYGWTITAGYGCNYYTGIGAGTGLVGAGNYYTGVLPSITQQYFVAANSTMAAGQKTILSQTMAFTGITGTTSFILSLCAFPGTVVSPLHTLTVYMNGITLLNNMSMGSVANAPYSTYNLPFIVSTNGTYTLSMVFYCPTTAASYIGVTGVQIFNATVPGIGAYAVDATSLNLYYPLDMSAGLATAGDVFLNDYATGLPVTDASFVGGASIVSTQPTPVVGTGCASLVAANKQYISMGPVVVAGTGAVAGAGFTVAGWFYPQGGQTSGATIFSLNGVSGATISLEYRSFYGQTNYLRFYVNGILEYIVSSYSITPGLWYFYTMTASWSAATGTATYLFYLNSTLIQTITSTVWPGGASGTTYTKNTLGVGAIGGTVGGASGVYFNGFMDDFRVYGRTLTAQDIIALWNYNGVSYTNAMNYTMVDSYSLNMYYQFDIQNLSATYAPILVVSNGGFTLPVVATVGGSVKQPALPSWSITSGASYTLYGVGATVYKYGLPSAVSQYLAIGAGSGTGVNAYTFSQTMTLAAGNGVPTQYMLSFMAFPLDGGYQAGHTMSVYLGNAVLVKNQSFGVSSSTVPYSSYNLPFQLTSSGTFTLSFVFSNTGGMTSSIGIANIRVASNTMIGTGYNAVDPSGLAMYYPLSQVAGTVGGAGGVSVYDYMTGAGILDASLNGGAGLVTSAPTPFMGSACLFLNASLQQSMALNTTFTLASVATVGAGFSMSGWFYASGGQAPQATLFSLGGAGAGQISLAYKSYLGNNQYLDFLVSGCVEYVAANYPIIPNTWYFYTLVASCQDTRGNTNTTYQFYLNGTLMGTRLGPWPLVTSYTNNTVGVGAAAGVGGMGSYFNGALQDLRFYQRALSAADVFALWSFGVAQQNNYFGLIDTGGMGMYYAFDAGLVLNYTVLAVIDLATTNGFFNIPALTTNTTSGLNPGALTSWQFSNNAQYYLYNGSAVYNYSLPTNVSQYLGMVGLGTGVASTMYQTLTVTVTASTQFVLSFYAFPADGRYMAGQRLTVTMGGMTLLSNYGLGVASGSVPYNTFNLPFTVAQTGNYPLVFSFTNPLGTTGSVLCIAGVSVANVYAGSSTGLVDPSGLALYYPLTTGSSNGTTLYDYATGTGVVDASLTGLANIVGGVGTVAVGTGGSLALTGSGSGAANLGTFNLPSVPNSGSGGSAGFSVSCWFDPSGVQTANACLFSLRNTGGFGISCLYNGSNNWLDLSVNGVTYDIIPNMYPIPTGSWNFLVLVGSCAAGAAVGGANYTLYLNNQVVQTFVGNWPDTSSNYVKNTLGYGGAAGVAAGWSYFTGYIDDFRVYTRALTTNDVAALWNYGTEVNYGNLIDPVGLQIYYPFDQGTYFNYSGRLMTVNGKFNANMLTTNGVSGPSPGIYGWSFSAGAQYYLYNGTNGYNYGLPTGVNQYIGVGAVAGGGSVTMTQTIPTTSYVTADNNYLVTFCAFPLDGSYNPAQTMSVSLGGVVLLNGVSLTASSGTVPYTSYTLPLTVGYTGNFALTFTFSNPVSVAARTSTICIANVQVVLANTPALGYQVVDPTGLALYYPFDPSAGIVGTTVYDYATGTGVADGVAVFGASVGTQTGLAGLGYLALSSANNQYVTASKSISIGTGGVGAGFSITGWFNTTSAMPNFNACIFSWLGNVANNNISLFLQRNNNYLDFSCNGVQEVVGGDTVIPNCWHYFAMVAKYTGAGANGTSYTYYFNDQSVTVTGAWPTSTTYTGLLLGQNAATGLGFFNGSLDDFRIYTRALSPQDVMSIWNYGLAYQKQYGNLIDTVGLQIYYPFSQGSELSYYADSFNKMVVANGGFTALPVSGVSAAGVAVPNWTVVTGTGGSYVVCGPGATGYGYGLPTGVSQYVAVSAGAAGTSTSLSQPVNLVLTNPALNQYVLSFYVFPLDGVYNASQVLTVSWGNMILLNGVSLTMSAGTVPYTSFNIPMVLNYSGVFPLTFTFTNTSTGILSSTMAVTGISVVSAGGIGAGYNTVDQTGLALYYSFDTNTYNNTLIQDYATGAGVIDASMSTAGMVAALAAGEVGSACISFSAALAQYATLGAFTVPTVGAGVGFSVSCWFYPVGSQGSNAGLFSFQNTTGGSISAFYSGTKNWLDISSNPGNEYVAWSYRIVPNTWNLLTYVVAATGGSGVSAATHTYYLNDGSMARVVGAWPDTGSAYTKNILGGGTAVGGPTGLGFFNGALDDVRVYTRALSAQDVFSLWYYGGSSLAASLGAGAGVGAGAPGGAGMGAGAGNLVDPTGLQVYYPFDQGTLRPVFNTPTVVFTGYSGFTVGSGSLTLTLADPTTFFQVSVTRNTGGGAGGAPLLLGRGVATYTDTGLRADTSYNYTVVPYSEYAVQGPSVTCATTSPTSAVAFTGYTGVVTNSLVVNFDTGTLFYNVGVTRITAGVAGTAAVVQPVGQYTFTDVSLVPNTAYSYAVTSYNALGVAGGVIATTGTIYTLPSITWCTTVPNPTQILVNVQGYYSYFRWTNTVTGTTATLGAGVTSFLDNTGIVYKSSYSYTIVPYNVTGVAGTAFTLGPIPAMTVLVNDVCNGTFLAPSVGAGTKSLASPSVMGWTFSPGMPYYLYNGSGAGLAYGGILPSASPQYVALGGGGVVGGVYTMSQSIYLSTVTMDTQFVVSFAVFPLDGSYNTGQTLGVTLGNVVLLQNYTLPVSTGTVPYYTLNFPVTIGSSGNYTLTFTVKNSSAVPSWLGLTNIIVENYNNAAGGGFNAIDPSGQAMYYCMDPSAGIIGSTLYDYANVSAVADAVVYNNAAISTAIPLVGPGDLYISSASSQYAGLGTFILPTGAVGAGIAVAGWFYSLGNQATNAVVFCLNSDGNIVDGNTVLFYYSTVSGKWNFLVDGVNYSMTSVSISPNTWNFFAVTLTYGSAGATGTTYSYYLNGSLLGTGRGPWPAAGSYANNTLGWANGFGYFNGYIDDFRVYTRVLTANDVYSLWNYGVVCNPSAMGTVVDTNSMVMYYNFDTASVSPTITPPVAVVAVVNGGFTVPTLAAGSKSGVNPGGLTGWTVSAGTNSTLYNGTAVYANAGTLPGASGGGAVQYLGVQGVGKVSQTLSFTLGTGTSTSTNYILSFNAFPADNSYNVAQTMSVFFGNMALVNGMTFTASSSSVPYTPFVFPVTVSAGGGPYTLSFVFQGAGGAAASSTICIANVNVYNQATTAVTYGLVNPSSLVLYYPFDPSTVVGSGVYNFATGVNGILPDASLNAGATIVTTVAAVGTGSVSLLAASSQYVSVGALMVPAATTLGVGVTITGWFYPVGAQTSYAGLFNLVGPNGNITLSYNGSNPWLDFSANGGVEYVASSYPVVGNAWNFFAYTILYNGTNATHTFYLNNKMLTTVAGAYPGTTGPYTNNTLGGGGGLGYFNGYMDDFRAYTRVLSTPEIGALFNYGNQPSINYSVVDTSGISMYYTFDIGTFV